MRSNASRRPARRSATSRDSSAGNAAMRVEATRTSAAITQIRITRLRKVHPPPLSSCLLCRLLVQSFRKRPLGGGYRSSLLFDLDLTIGSLNCSAPLADHTLLTGFSPKTETGLANRPLRSSIEARPVLVA